METNTGPSPTDARTENRAARWSLVLGVLSVPAAMVTVGALTGAVAIVQGVKGVRHAQQGAGQQGMAIAGLVLGAIAIAMVVLYYTVGND